MVKLEKSQALGRTIRQDDATELSIPTWTLVREAVRAGKTDEALQLVDYGCSEDKATHDSVVGFVEEALAFIATVGEEQVLKFLRKRCSPMVSRWLSATPWDVEESLHRGVEFQRGHGGSVAVFEEADRYVLRCDPCGSGGQLRRTRDVTKLTKAYPWTWGKKDIPIYCTHCCVIWEILPTELRGYPIRINMIGAKPEDPCIHYYYKKPELIPEEYFTRIGMTKTKK